MAIDDNKAERLAFIRNCTTVLGSTDDKTLLDLAEAAGHPSTAADSIATTVGLPFSNFDGSLQSVLKEIIFERLLSLRETAIAKRYNWYY